ncbi:MAG: hypothetical protein AAFR98_12840 [Pseudomonadota bacterium]
MLSEDEKRQIEQSAAEQMRQQWGDVRPSALAAAVDDIRARVIEEGWFDKPMLDLSHEVQRAVAMQDLYGAREDAIERQKDRDDVAELA